MVLDQFCGIGFDFELLYSVRMKMFNHFFGGGKAKASLCTVHIAAVTK